MKETFDSGKVKSFKKDSRLSKESKNVTLKSHQNTDNFFYVDELSEHFDDVEEDSYQDDQEVDYQELEDENIENGKRIVIEEFDEYEPPKKKLAVKGETVNIFECEHVNSKLVKKFR